MGQGLQGSEQELMFLGCYGSEPGKGPSLPLNLSWGEMKTGEGLPCALRQLRDLSSITSTHCGLSHWRVLNFTPVPQVREQEPNGVQAPQLPSRLRMSGVSQMQWPLKQC